MPTIGASVSLDMKEKFETAARVRCTTASRLAAALIAEFLGRGTTPHMAQDLPQAPRIGRAVAGEARTAQVFVRLTPYYYAELGRLAAERHWYRSTYLANLFHAHAERQPVLCDAEIDALRQVARQLAALGRNIKHITQQNAAPARTALASAVDVEMLRLLIEGESQAVQALIRANLKGWGIIDGQA